MKLLFISAYYPPSTKGGAEISAHLLGRGLVKRGHQVTVLTEGTRQEEFNLEGVEVVKMPLGLRGKPLFEHRKSKNMANKIRSSYGKYSDYDIIHAHDFRGALVVAELAGKQKKMVTVRDYAQISGSTNFVKGDWSIPHSIFEDSCKSHRIAEALWPRKIGRWWQYAYNVGYRKECFNKFDWQVFISDEQRRLIGKYNDLTRQRTAVIYNPIARDYLSGSVKKGNKGLVTYVGTVEDYKGVGLLIAAWREVIKREGHAHLKIVGDGADRKKYEGMVDRQGLQYKVSFAGHVPWQRLKSVYDITDVAVVPHLWIEPFGRTCAEAMSRGKVVVAADAGGPAEMISNMKSGILFQRGKVDDLIEKLSLAISMNETKRAIMGREAKRWAEENLREDIIAKRYENLYVKGN